MNSTNNILRTGPVVTCVGNDYVIIVPLKKNALIHINVSGKCYYCHSNGVRITNTQLQKFTVPMEVLDEACEYSLVCREIISRCAYSCEMNEEIVLTYKFKPLRKTDGINIYHISDTHGVKSPAVKAASFFGDSLDLLILNGDISSSSSTEKEIFLQYDIAFGVTKGEVPCIITRGNHDLRGRLAEKLPAFLPTSNGNTYYTVRLGSLWFMILDCGEDKEDSHREYSSTVCCHEMRLAETDFIKEVVENAPNEFDSPSVKNRFIISHVPFCFDNTELCRGERPFNIEREIYGEWCSIIRERISPDLLISGHLHKGELWPIGDERDNKKIHTPVVIGGYPEKNKNGRGARYIGCALTVLNKEIQIRFTNSDGKILSEYTV